MKKWLFKAIGLLAAAVFVLGYLLPLLISGGTFSVLVGVALGAVMLVSIVFEGYQLLDELRVLMENEKK